MQVGAYQSTYPFTARLRAIIEAASETARTDHERTTSEHLLLALVNDSGGVAALVLQAAGVTPDALRVELATSPAASTAPARAPSPRDVMELAEGEARELGHSYLGTEHLLLALLRLPASPAVAFLHGSGLSHDRARREVIRLLASSD